MARLITAVFNSFLADSSYGGSCAGTEKGVRRVKFCIKILRSAASLEEYGPCLSSEVFGASKKKNSFLGMKFELCN